MESSSPEHLPTDMEVLKKMEDEHLHSQRQVRLIQTDRQHRSLGVHPQFRRQDHLLRTLKKEYLNLHKDLKIARSGAHKKNDKRMKQELTRALLSRTEHEEEREENLTLMEQLDELLQEKKKELLLINEKVIANNGELEVRRALSDHRLSSAENKLEIAMWSFNEVQCENKKVRQEIEHMLNDRALFNQSWNKMMSALSKGKKFLTDLFESSTLAYDQRDEWCAKLKSAQEKGKVDQMVQIQEMRDLQKAFDHEMKLYNFLAKKGVIRINKEEEKRAEDQKKKEEEEIEKNLKAHDKIFSDINDYTEEHDVDKIIEQFERVEQENFSIYKLLNEYCAENEVLKRGLEKIKQDIEDRRDWNEMAEENRQEKLQQLRDKLEKQKLATEDKRTQLTEKSLLIEDTMKKVTELFNLLDCSLEPYQNLLGDKQPSLHHVNLTFRLITEKIQELVQITYYCERHVQRKDKSSSRLKKYTVRVQPPEPWSATPITVLVPAEPCPACIEARWLSRVSDTPETPFTRAMSEAARLQLEEEPAFERSDRIHALAECRAPQSRLILAKRYMPY
ncbi:coiled-coil domain-containing protein 63-like [Bicyclus anynana]|uniref:Coiled-coil domain-containing protein 63-like n=1 Tax=Bicyclus anynana TaxID=110368 RepID=A0A6J1NH50_BICAN|nr:coiled-coil domain-containing protein 63-like [Bicyclus anynana]